MPALGSLLLRLPTLEMAPLSVFQLVPSRQLPLKADAIVPTQRGLANRCIRWSNSTQDTTERETRRQRKVVRDLLRPKRLLLKDETFRHILPNDCNYASSMPYSSQEPRTWIASGLNT